ncbi:MAG: tetratricopeptide repeat protein [Bacteroidales bacterium]|nr:tetratricopeptide repeat protein [Bacteroidales bacterium]
MKKKLLIILCFLLPSFNPLLSQDIEKGKWYIVQKQYESAGKIFRSILKNDPSDSKTLYYLGKVYDFKGKSDSAEIFYQQGIMADEKYPFNFLGLGKMQLNKSNRTEWFKFYDKGRKLSNNLFEYNLEAGEVCLLTTTQNFDLSGKYLEAAKEENAKDCRLLVSLGDLYLTSKSPGDAVNEYERAIYHNDLCVQAFVKMGEIYAKANNYRDGINAFNQAVAIDSTQILAYKERGDLYYSFGKYDEAKADYEIYIRRSDNTIDDKERFAFILFFTKNYDQSRGLIDQVIQNDTNNTVMYRIAAYIDFEKGDFPNSLKNLEYFFTHHDTTKFIAIDYIYYGHLLMKNGQDSLGTLQLETALQMDTTKTELYDEIGKSYSKQKEYQKAIDAYVKLLSLNANNKSNSYYQIGRNFYFMAEDSLLAYDSLFKAELYQEADCCFENMTLISPDSYIGYIWSGRALSRLDPETTSGLAKPAYEKSMMLLEAGDITKTPKLLIECYRYLGFYHYMLGEKLLSSKPAESEAEMTNSLNYWTKILNLDPSDQQAQTALQNLLKK